MFNGSSATEKCFEEVGQDATKLFQSKLAISGNQSHQLQEHLTLTAKKGWHRVRFGVYLLISMALLSSLTMFILFISDNINYLRIYFQNIYNQKVSKKKQSPIPIPIGLRVRMYVYILLGVLSFIFLLIAFQLYKNRFTLAGEMCESAKKALAIVS